MFKKITVLLLICLFNISGLARAEDQFQNNTTKEEVSSENETKQDSAEKIKAEKIKAEKNGPQQNRTQQSGVVKLEQSTDKKVDQYATAQNSSITYLEDLKNNIELMRTNPSASAEMSPLNKDQLLYFASAYLLCISKKGTCNFILDTIMESDFQILCEAKNGNCQKPKQVACQNMNSFWKTWLAYDFEQRQNHMLPVGLMGENNRFRQEDFPAYLKCNSTQIKPLTKILSGEQTLQRRYEINKNILVHVEKTYEYFESIKKNVRNIFLTLGVQELKQVKE